MNVTYNLGSKITMFLIGVVFFLLPSYLTAEATKNLAVFYELEGNAEKKYNAFIEEKLPKIGFNMADPHHRVNDQYKSKYGSTKLDVLSFLPVVNDNNVMPLFNIDPRLAGFAPFNMLIYKNLDDKNTHVGHLTPEAILDIIGISDKRVRDEFTASFKPLDELMDKEFGAKKSYIPLNIKSKDTMINFEYEFKRPEDIDDFIDEFQNSFEMNFINKKYLIAGFHNFKDTDNGEEMLEGFDLFWAYSLCHLKYSYNMFDNEGGRPDAGLFAPCTMYMYVKKDSNILVVGMPKLVNIMDSLEIKDPKRVALIKQLDGEIPEVLKAFGMKAVENVNPLKERPKEKSAKIETLKKEVVKKEKIQKEVVKEIVAKKVERVKEEKSNPKSSVVVIKLPTVPTVPTPVTVEVNGVGNSSQDRSIKFSKRMPPNYMTSAERYGKGGEGSSLSHSTKMVGEVDKGRISAYLRGELIDIKVATEKLKKAGFEVIATLPLNKKKSLISIVFTNADLKKMASRTNRGYLATMRLLIDPKNSQISITNPLYLAKAMLQNEFNEEEAKRVLMSINSEFKGLRNSMDKLKFQLLPKYQFMQGMPFYQDAMVIARGGDLLRKIKNNKYVLFELKLDNGATLIGVKLGKRTRKFPKRIGTNNAGMLPYPLLIENGEAKILDPKYYLSLMYPQLSMEGFMTIATVPDAIRKDCGRVFK